MEKLPVELLIHIFRSASVDGGYTACSLSLVCTQFRDVVRPVRFHSVALDGSPIRLNRFLDILERESTASPTGGRVPSKVRHLFVQIASLASNKDDHNWSNDSPDDIHNTGGSTVQTTERDQRTSLTSYEDYIALVRAVLRLLAADLHTLVLFQHNHAHPVIKGISFPSLHELTFRACRKPIDEDYEFSPLEGPPLYPSLSRLHLLSGELSVDHWAYHAPNLTHIRVSNYSGWRGPTEFARVHEIAEDAADPRPFQQLQQMIIQPTVPPHVRRAHGLPFVRYRRNLRVLWATQAEASIPVYIPPPRELEPQERPEDPRQSPELGLSHVRTVRLNWEDRIEGRLGCWDVSEKHARGTFEGNILPLYLMTW
ncbi:hypothetical protein C8Q78DRAFT_1021334 [Trametes maxima]|nr:hypothetical protein C8Q78DRAFT_1021334 [Trametes maxima]